MSLVPTLYFTASCLKLPYISKLVDLNNTFKISPKAIMMGASSQFHRGAHLEKIVLPTPI